MSILTQRLSGILRMFKPVELKLSGQEVIRPRVNMARTNNLAINLSEQETVDIDPAELQIAIENNPGMLKRLNIVKGMGREGAIQELRKGYTEVVELARSVRVALDQQSAQTAQMAKVLEKLPRALESLPETNRNQGRMVEAMHAFLQKQEMRDGQLQTAIGEMSVHNDQQTEILMVMQQQFDMTQANQLMVNQTVDTLSQTLTGMSNSSSAMTDAMLQIAHRMESRDEQMTQVMKNQRKTIMVAATIGSILMLTGLLAGWYAGNNQIDTNITPVNNNTVANEALTSAAKD